MPVWVGDQPIQVIGVINAWQSGMPELSAGSGPNRPTGNARAGCAQASPDPARNRDMLQKIGVGREMMKPLRGCWFTLPSAGHRV